MPRRDWKKELKDKAEEDNAKILSIINGENKTPFDECRGIKRCYKCEFQCSCGNIYVKKIRVLVEGIGFYCHICTKNKSQEKINIIYDEKTDEEKREIINKRIYTRKNRTDEEKQKSKEKLQNKWKNKSKEDLSKIIEKRKQTNRKKTKEQIQASIIKGVNKRKNRTEEQKQKTKRKIQNTWNNKPKEEIEEIINRRKETFNKKPEYEKQAIFKKISQRMLNMTYEEKIKKLKRTEETSLKKFGCKNASQSEIIKEKKRIKSRERYGTDYVLQAKEVIDKRVITMLSKSEEELQDIKRRRGDTNLKKHGHRNVLVAKRSEIEQTWMKNFGKDNPSKCPKIQNKKIETSRKNWGTDYPMQNNEVFRKAMKNRKSGFKSYEYPSGKNIKIRGYENICLDDLLNEGYSENEIITDTHEEAPVFIWIDSENKSHKYHPDMLITTDNKIIEVKSSWTYEKDFEKIQACREVIEKQGYIYEVRIYDEKTKTYKLG